MNSPEVLFQNDSLLEFEKVGFSFFPESKKVVSNFSICLAAGEMVGIIGPNGAGKTTILRLCAGLLKPSSGHIKLLGKDLFKWKRLEIAKTLALVPQHSLLPFAFTVEELILMGRSPYMGPLGLEKQGDLLMVESALEELDLSSLARRPMSSLSGGERQRALIARALVQDPLIMLCDEPSSHLDLAHQIRLFKALRSRIAEKKISVLVVMHDLNLAAATCDRLLLMHEGNLLKSGNPREVLNADYLEMAYGTEVVTGTDKQTGNYYVLPKINNFI